MPSDPLRAHLQSSLGAAYTLERELGGGGMSRVFVAQEVGLGRPVVVKVLPPELAADVSVDRFRREIQVGAQLQHPHIVPVLTAGAGDDLLYYTMPLVEGESLRQRLTSGPPLSSAEAVRIWREVLDALAYAHSRGVVHRDIKPENILLSHDHALVTDFGIARAVEAATDGLPMTATGLALGTPAYMAPEQAAGERTLDHRADLYAAGLVMYEMLAGAPAFSRRTARELVVAQLTQPAPKLVPRDAACPREVIALVMRCLEKEPAARPATAHDVIVALDALGPPRTGTPAAQRGRRRALLATGIAMLLVIAAGTLAVTHRFPLSGPAGPADDSLKLTVMVAETNFDRADSTLGNNFVDAVVSGLGTDPWITALSPRDVLQWASLDGFSPRSLTRDTLIFFAKRGRTSAYLTLGLSRAGTGYVLTAAATGTRNDNQLPTVTAAANSAADIPAAIHALTSGLRKELFARRADLPFSEPVFTIAPVSPRALEYYERGKSEYLKGDWSGAAGSFQAAVDEDSTFEDAWMALVAALGNAGLSDARQAVALSHAYRRRRSNRSLVKQIQVAGDYWWYVGRPDSAVVAFDSMLKLMPNPDRAGINEEALAFVDLRRYDVAAATYRRLIDASYRTPGSFKNTTLYRANLVWPLLAEGKLEEARAELAHLRRTDVGGFGARGAGYEVLASTRAWGDLASLARAPLPDTDRASQLDALQYLGLADAVRGQLSAFDSVTRQRAALFRAADSPSGFLSEQMARASIVAGILGDTARAKAIIDSALRTADWPHMEPLDRHYADVIAAFADVGDVKRGGAYAAEWARVRRPEFRMVDSLTVLTARGEAALAAGDPREALRLFHAADIRYCDACFYPRYARAYDALRMPDSARVWYEKYAAATNPGDGPGDALDLARTYRRLGVLYEERGDFSRALAYYQDFVNLWRHADTSLQPAVRDVDLRIARLRAHGG